jgi:polyisoprenoid-binding protein YceI
MTAPVSTRDFNGNKIPTAGTFVIDTAHSTVGFVARHMVVSKVRGSFKEFSGTVVIGEDPLDSRVDVSIKAASIDTNSPDRDGHLRSDDFLNAEKYPDLTFRSTGLIEPSGNEFKLVGELTIRDVTKPVTLQVEFDGTEVSPWGQEVVAFTATTEIDRDEFGATWNQALESGGVVVGKKVKIEIVAELNRQAPAA